MSKPTTLQELHREAELILHQDNQINDRIILESDKDRIILEISEKVEEPARHRQQMISAGQQIQTQAQSSKIRTIYFISHNWEQDDSTQTQYEILSIHKKVTNNSAEGEVYRILRDSNGRFEKLEKLQDPPKTNSYFEAFLYGLTSNNKPQNIQQ